MTRYVIRCNADATEWCLTPATTTGYVIVDVDTGQELPVVHAFEAPDWDAAKATFEAYRDAHTG